MRITVSILLIAIYCSCTTQSTPEAVVVQAPTSAATAIKNGEYFLLLYLKKDHSFWYKYDTVQNEASMTEVAPVSTPGIVSALDEIEKKNNLQLSSFNNILVKSDFIPNNRDTTKYTNWNALKEALKQKQVFRFRIVTNNVN